MQIRGVTMLLEGLEVLGSVAAHRLHHLLTQFHLRRQRLRVSSKDESKVHVEKFSVGCKQQIVVVAVANTQNIGDDAVACGKEGEISIYFFGCASMTLFHALAKEYRLRARGYIGQRRSSGINL